MFTLYICVRNLECTLSERLRRIANPKDAPNISDVTVVSPIPYRRVQSGEQIPYLGPSNRLVRNAKA